MTKPARLIAIAITAALIAAVAAPPLVAGGQDDNAVTVAKKKKKKKKRFQVRAEGAVDHGMGQSDVNVEETVRNASKAGKPPVSGATVTGELTEPPAGSSASASAVLDGEDSAVTNAQGKASLSFTIDSYGPKRVTITVKKKGFVTSKKTYTYVVGPDEGPLEP
jgi:hypothetical protein